MITTKPEIPVDAAGQETSEWLEALDQVVDEAGQKRASELLQQLMSRAAQLGVTAPMRQNTPYVNTIPVSEEVPYPGDREIERRIKSYVRWNAMAMVVRANKYDDGIGGHISTFASLASISEVGFNHFFRGSIQAADGSTQPGDFIYYQGHASPGVYSRAFLEGRLSEEHLMNFRHELRDKPGLSSYPHPWLMPDFWQFPTVSMGLGPINSIYHARFLRYLENRSLIPVTDRKVIMIGGDGETDEPESLGALTLASREKLDNLIFIINCNLQRLDGPVRGNGSIIQELEGAFRGAGWNTIKCLWGSNWDPLFAKDKTGILTKRMAECVDGEYQNFKVRGPAYARSEFFGKYPELAELVADLSDDDIANLKRGGHDPVKVYNALRRAYAHRGGPTVILMKSIKGYGMGEAGEGKNVAHNQKKLNETELEYVRKRFSIPVPAEAAMTASFYKPDENSPEAQYIRKQRAAMGGPVPSRNEGNWALTAPSIDSFAESLGGSAGRPASTTAAFVGILKSILKEKAIAKYIVPIVPDEARTFGMESLFRQVGIYASQGQLYKPVDSDMFLYYKESRDGQILEEGITEAGSMASFTAAGTAYANLNTPMIPFYIYYSMFGFQRVGDQVWAFADARGKGFMIGGTAGRSTLNGEGLQHQDGHTHVLFSVVPTCQCYDPAYAYELAVIIQDGIRRMYQDRENIFYYITAYNENYPQPAMPTDIPDIENGIRRGIYKLRKSTHGEASVQLWGSGPMLNEALRAQEILAQKFNIAADVWSVTSYVNLRRDAIEVERWNRLHPNQTPRRPLVQQVLDGSHGPIIASSEYMKVLADQLAPWLDGRLTALGTDGFGRSENRAHLRRFFEIDAESIAAAALSRLAREGKMDANAAAQAIRDLGLDPEAPNPATL
ncbi:pyruvate dehydrogenase (acetyl-transferring), homodimeric type [Bryobacter aggregatus]|uniref:pyruvate dehydrogenase (acetyl-transferring), homodimeric type n=1 Tax=Bryobacter aggregatus TaxID=360054 RepID=UPI0006913459|nr:pyruvate dehydrogenase (acetyl-transferring), homodimeric type [Bryobacter aggregatus]